MNLPIDKLFFLIDFLGVFVGAFGGALAAVRDTRYRYDLVGVTGLALVSALGGGITRDLILQKGPPLAFADVRYLITALAGAVIGMLFAHRIGKNTERAIIFIDAAALGLFSVSGSTRALNNGMTILPAFLLGVTTAVGGGCIRDVLSGRTPKIFERGELYAIASALGAAMFESEEWRKRSFKRIHQLKQHTGKQSFACSDPLSMAKVTLFLVSKTR